jgi:hypothetical protein
MNIICEEEKSESSQLSHKKILNAVSLTWLEKGITFVNILLLAYVYEVKRTSQQQIAT